MRAHRCGQMSMMIRSVQLIRHVFGDAFVIHRILDHDCTIQLSKSLKHLQRNDTVLSFSSMIPDVSFLGQDLFFGTIDAIAASVRPGHGALHQRSRT